MLGISVVSWAVSWAASMPSSVLLPSWMSIVRNADDTFTVSADGTPFTPDRTVPSTVRATEPFDLVATIEGADSATAPLVAGQNRTIKANAARLRVKERRSGIGPLAT